MDRDEADYDNYYDDVPSLDSMRADVIDHYSNKGCPPGYCWDFFDGMPCDGSCGYRHSRPPARAPTAQERTPKKRKIQEEEEAFSERVRANGITPPDEQARSLLEAGNADQLTPAQAKAYLKLHACACSGTKAGSSYSAARSSWTCKTGARTRSTRGAASRNPSSRWRS